MKLLSTCLNHTRNPEVSACYPVNLTASRAEHLLKRGSGRDSRRTVHIIIVGAGEVGSYLAKILIEETHDVSVIEADEKLARALDDSLDALVIHGSGVNKDILRRAGIEKASLFIAVTQVDEVNLIACMTARKFGNPKTTIARVRDIEYLHGESALSTEDMGIDLLVSPEHAVANRVVSLLEFEGTGEQRALAGGKLILLELFLGEESPLVNEPLENLGDVIPENSLITAIYDGEKVRIPRGHDVIRP